METRKNMSKRQVIVKFCVICLLVVIGGVLTFVPFRIPLINNGATKWVSFVGAVESRMGIDLQGGVLAVYDAEPNPAREGDFGAQLNATVRRLQNTLTGRGFVEATVTTEGGSRIRVEVPGINESSELMRIIGEPAEIDFRTSQNESDIFITGKHLTSVDVVPADQLGTSWGVRVSFTNEGGQLFRNAVQTVGQGNQIHIYANGRVISSPRIDDTSVGSDNTALITSPDFRSRANAENLALQIESGLFEVLLSINRTGVIPPTLGDDALLAGILAFVIGLAFIFVFMYFLYGHLGLLSNLSMLIYSILFLGALAVVNMVQLTLPGVAGIILAMAMAVDANIIIFERIKDEYKTGKRLGIAVEDGFKKSFWTIFDANITTILGAGILFFVGTGPIQGFAITLLLGVLVSMFCSLVVTRGLVRHYMILNPNDAKKLRMGHQSMLVETRDSKTPVRKTRSLNLK